ncbi:MAG: hypothetical protein FWF53_06320 [Candidatus Azobacteroides sp.]|nr:hypothetical protein [Candidatus Azobacteroides sp.]
MKKYISELFLLVFCILLLPGCDSNTNMPDITTLNYPKITPDPTSDQLINMLKDPDLFHGKLTVDVYFSNKDLPQAATLVVAKNGDYDNVKTIQTISQFPTVVDITGTQLRNLFNEDIVLNDVFEVGMDLEYNGIVYKAFNSDGRISYSSDLWSLPGSNPIQTYDATYLLDLNDFTGSFHVVDEWWDDEYDVTISRSPSTDNQLVVDGMLGADGDAGSIVIDVNMATQIPQLNSQVVLKSLVPFGMPYTNMAYTGSGRFNIPAQTMTFSISVSVTQGSFSGTYSLVFSKN